MNERQEGGCRACPGCGKTYSEPGQVETIDALGECAKCDHVRGDAAEDTNQED